MKKFMGFLMIFFLLSATLIGCTKTNEADSSTPTIKSQSDGMSLEESEKVNTEIMTAKSYKVNDEIPVGSNTEIIKKEGVFYDQVYWRDEVLFLGADENGNIRTFNLKTSDIESIDENANLTVLLNIMEGRENHVFAIKMLGDLVAWSECPYGNMDPATDRTRGRNWAVYFADLKTNEIIKIDGDKGVTVPAGTQYGYLAPNEVFLSPDTISYISFDYNSDGEVTSVIKLYTISEQKLETVDYLNEDLTQNAFGYPSVSGDKMTWCKAHVNEDGTYTGFSYLYDLKTKIKSKLVTDENIINPIISGDYILAQGEPNKTFYDSEVCIYDINKNQWVFKINNGYSQYNKHYDVYLTFFKNVGNYLYWVTPVTNSLVLFNHADCKLYNIVQLPSNMSADNAQLLDGGLLIWFERPNRDWSKTLFKYIILK